MNKKRRGRKRRERESRREEQRHRREKGRMKRTSECFCWSAVVGKKKKEKSIYSTQGKLTFVAEFSVRVHVVKMAEPLPSTNATPPTFCEQKKEEEERRGREKKKRRTGKGEKREGRKIMSGCLLVL